MRGAFSHRQNVGVNVGSPPRMRGAFRAKQDEVLNRRITPAHAGSIKAGPNGAPTIGDHPRACGEHLTMALPMVVSEGSPPRMRGAFERDVKLTWRQRITPAHAGSMGWLDVTLPWPKDHPRACGEHPRYLLTELQPQGSPPRMRGAL